MLEQPIPFIHLCLWIVEASNDMIKFEPICIAIKVVIRQCENFVDSHNDRLPDSDLFLAGGPGAPGCASLLWTLICDQKAPRRFTRRPQLTSTRRSLRF